MRIKKAVSILLCCCALLTFGACNEECEHEFKWYESKSPTCEEKGEMEGVCKKCGQKQYVDVEELEHDYDEDGICVNCGKEEERKEEVAELPEGWSFAKMYEETRDYGMDFTKDEFIETFTQNNAQTSVYVGGLGQLCVEMRWTGYDSMEISFFDVRCEYDLEENGVKGYVDEIISCFRIVENELLVIYGDGTQENYGTIDELVTRKRGTRIAEIAINEDNEVMLVYTTDEVEMIGVLADDELNVDESTLIYEKITGGYAVAGIIDQTATEIIIPASHRGLPVISVKESAFYNNDTVELLAISDSVKEIGDNAFRHCDNLEEIKLGGGVEEIKVGAFANSTSLSKIVFNGTSSKWNTIQKGYYWNDNTAISMVVCTDSTLNF